MAKYLEDKRRRLQGQQSGQVQTQAVNPAPKAQTPVQTQAAAPAPAEKQTYTAPTAPAEKQSATPAPAQTTTAPVQTPGNDVVAQAQQYLNQQLGGYNSRYGSQITDLVQQLQDRPKFEYDVNTDPLYLQLRDIWKQDGLMAMEDTMGQAAQLTGGYGNSHAQMAGQQVYNNHLREVAEMVPQLKEAARADYDADTDVLLRNLGLLMDQDNTDYARWMDEISRQQRQEELEYQRGRDELADQRYDREWEYQTGRDTLADQRYQDELDYSRKQQSYDRLLELIITTGYKPTAEELAAAGMTEAEAKAWRGYWQRQQAASGGSGGGGSRRSSSSGGDGQATPAVSDVVNAAIENLFGAQKTGESVSGDQGAPKDYAGVEAECKVFKANGAPDSMVAEYLGDALSGGTITKGQYNTLMKKYGGQEKKDSESSLYLSPVGGSGRGTYSRFN